MERLTKTLFFFSFFLSGLLCYPQQREKINIALRESINRKINSSEDILLLLKGEIKAIEKAASGSGANIKYTYKDIVAVNLPASKIKSFVLNAGDAIEHLEFHHGNGTLLNDKMLVNNKVDLVHDGLVPGIPKGLTGKGVLIGFIDSGLDFNHPDFKDSTGKTRVKFIWDQNQPVDLYRTPQLYGYGQEWTGTDIDQGICTHDDQPAYYGHGTNVAGTAAGNGLAIGKYKGVAPEADLVVVSTNFNAPNWLATVVDAVHYIFAKADSLEMPCVINASVGTYLGSHDGLDLSAQLIAAMVSEKRGRAFVCAAGNAADSFFHLGYNILPTPQFTWFKPNSTNGKVYFQLWADTGDFNDAEFSFGADKTMPDYAFRGALVFANIKNRLNIIKSDSLFSSSGYFLGIVETWCEQIDSRYFMEVQISGIDSANYNYRFITKGNGKLDIWSAEWLNSSDMVVSSLPAPGVFPDIAAYKIPDNNQSIVSSFSCLPEVITVGNYTNRNSFTAYHGNEVNIGATVGEISASSSRGPTRTGLVKPDIAATGNTTICPGRLATLEQLIITEPDKVVEGGKHNVGGGTSMASPVVAGIAALYMQLCPEANQDEIKKAVIETASSDNFTGTIPNNTYGHGKINGAGVVSKGIVKANIISSDYSTLCKGDSIILSSQEDYPSYLWNTGDTSKSIDVSGSGIFTLSVQNIQKCKSHSAVFNVGFAESPTEPFIWRNENVLNTIAANAYQWFLNGEKISGANAKTLEADQDGNYSVMITNANNCSIHSAVFPFVLFTGDDLKVNLFPNPTSGILEIGIKNNTAEVNEIEVVNFLGQVVLSKRVRNTAYNFTSTIDLSPFEDGVYTLRILNKENISSIKIVKGK